MAGEPQYTFDQIALILLRWIQKFSSAATAVEYSRVFNVDIAESRVRYVKNKYCKEPRFGTPLWNYPNRPKDYEKFLKENPPALFDPQKVQERMEKNFTPNGSLRVFSQISASIHPPSSGEQKAQPQAAKPAPRSRVRKTGNKAASRVKNAKAKAETASSAAPAVEATTTTAGGLSGYVAGTSDPLADTAMGGTAYPFGQQPLPELPQAPFAGFLPTNSFFQNPPEQVVAPYYGSSSAQGLPYEATTNTWDFTNGFMENQNEFNLYDPSFGNGWNDFLSFDSGALGVPEAAPGGLYGTSDNDIWEQPPDTIASSPTFYKSTLAADFPMPEEGPAEQSLAIDPALFESYGEGQPGNSASSLMDLLTSDDAPDFTAGEQKDVDDGGLVEPEDEVEDDWDPVLDENC